MADEEPTGWEVRRALEQHVRQAADALRLANQRIDSAVTRAEFEAERLRVNERHDDIRQDLSAAQIEREKQIGHEQQARIIGDTNQQATIDKLTANLRWVAAAILLPVGLFIATLYVNNRGG